MKSTPFKWDLHRRKFNTQFRLLRKLTLINSTMKEWKRMHDKRIDGVETTTTTTTTLHDLALIINFVESECNSIRGKSASFRFNSNNIVYSCNQRNCHKQKQNEIKVTWKWLLKHDDFYRDLCHCSKWLLYVVFMHIASSICGTEQNPKMICCCKRTDAMEKSVTLIYTAALSVTEWKIFQKHRNKQTNKPVNIEL